MKNKVASFINGYLHQEGLKTTNVVKRDEDGHLRDYLVIAQQNPDTGIITRLRGQDWTEIGEFDYSADADREIIYISLHGPYQDMSSRLSSIMDRAVRMAKLLEYVGPTTQIVIQVDPS